MQEIIKLVSVIRKDLEDIRILVSNLLMTHAQRISEEWMTIDQVMFTLKISASTLKILRRSGKLPYSKINQILYFRAIDVEELLNQHYINATHHDHHSNFKNKSHV